MIHLEAKLLLKKMAELNHIHFEIIDRNKHRLHMKKKEKERFDKLKQIGCIACQKKRFIY